MRLKNQTITNRKLLKDYFDFKEIWTKINIFLKDIADIVIGIDKDVIKKLQTLITQCLTQEYTICKKEPSLSTELKETISTLFLPYQSAGEKLYKKLSQDDFFTAIEKQNILYIVFSIYYLSNIEFTEKEIDTVAELFLDMKRNSTPIFLDCSDTITFCKGNNQPYLLQYYNKAANKESIIHTTKIINTSEKNGNEAMIHIIGKNNCLLYCISLLPQEYVYVNIIGTQFIEQLPCLSIGTNDIFFYDTLENQLSKIALDTTKQIYNFETIPFLKQVCADDDDGFLGILHPEGTLLPCSNHLEYRRIFKLNNIVKLCLHNISYLALLSDGSVCTNIEEARDWNQLLSIYISEDGTAYGLNQNGTLLSTDKNFIGTALKDIFLFSVYENEIIIKDTSAVTKHITQNWTRNDVQFFSIGSFGTILLLQKGILLQNDMELPDLYAIKEFTATSNYMAVMNKIHEIKVHCFKK